MVHKKNLRYVNDLVDEAGVFMSPTELISKFNLRCTFLQAYGIMCAIPSSWKSKIREFGKRLPVVKSQNIWRLFKTKKWPVLLTIFCESRLLYSQPRCSVNGINIYHLRSKIGVPFFFFHWHFILDIHYYFTIFLYICIHVCTYYRSYIERFRIKLLC